MKKCPKCSKNHIKKGTFCSRNCASSRGPMSDKQKELRRTYALSNPKGCISDQSKAHRSKKNIAKYTDVVCPTCHKLFSTLKTAPRVHCSRKCIRTGGLRKGSGRGKCGYYKGMYLQSTYELAYVIYCTDHAIPLKPCKDTFNYIDPVSGKQRTYYPDFVVGGIITEIKGYHTPTVDAKVQSVTKPFQILYKKDLAHVFKYVTGKTGLPIDKLYTLYDSKPST